MPDKGHEKPYNWSSPCRLDLRQAAMAIDPNTEILVFAMIDADGNEIYRNDITDPAILSGRQTWVDIDLRALYEGKPTRFILWPRRHDGTFADKHIFPVPAGFRQQYSGLFDWVLSKSIPERTVTCEIFGGLANQLFQIMTTVVFARQNGYVPIITDDLDKSPSMVQDQNTYWDKVFSSVVEPALTLRCDTRRQVVYPDPSFCYAPIPADHEHIKLYGYFTSYRYIDPERDYVLSLIASGNGLMKDVDRAYEKLKSILPADAETLVSMHIRRGDSLKNHTLKKLSIDYYRLAMKQFENAVFVIFSDDITWCRDHFDQNGTVFVEGNEAYVDLLLMSRCDHHIIANSTFSWWGAWLNRSNDKKIVYPYPWFVGEKAERDLSDFVYPEWIRLPA